MKLSASGTLDAGIQTNSPSTYIISCGLSAHPFKTVVFYWKLYNYFPTIYNNSIKEKCNIAELQTVLFNMRHPASGINSLTLSVSLIHILVFHLYHHQSLFLFFTLDLKHTSSSSLFHLRLHHRYWTDLTDSWPDHSFCSSVLFLIFG